MKARRLIFVRMQEYNSWMLDIWPSNGTDVVREQPTPTHMGFGHQCRSSIPRIDCRKHYAFMSRVWCSYGFQIVVRTQGTLASVLPHRHETHLMSVFTYE